MQPSSPCDLLTGQVSPVIDRVVAVWCLNADSMLSHHGVWGVSLGFCVLGEGRG